MSSNTTGVILSFDTGKERRRRLVLLLKTTSDVPDRYESALRSNGIDCMIVSPLMIELHEEQLRSSLLLSNNHDVVVTSPHVVSMMCDTLAQLPADEHDQWTRTHRVWCVGERSAQRLQSAGCRLCYSAHNAAELSTQIVTEYHHRAPVTTTTTTAMPAVLYLCGDNRRDELVTALQNAGISFHECCVYTSRPNTHLHEDINQSLASASSSSSDPPVCITDIVFFSPLGAQTFVSSSSSSSFASTARMIAFGTTTAKAMQEEYGLRVDNIPHEPTLQSLLSVLLTTGE